MNLKTIHLPETDSTNRFLHQLSAEEPSAENVLVTADFQTAGRGQGTNSWESERGRNLLFSLLVHPRHIPARRQFLLSEVEAVAIKEVLDDYVDGISLKWPNDIYWHDRKLGGTLIETNLSRAGVTRCIFGTGLNVNQTTFVSDAPNPVSLCQILGHELDRDRLLSEIIARIFHYLDLLEGNQFAEISTRYHNALYRRSGYHPYQDSAGEFEALIVEVEDDGHLILVDRQGQFRSYAFKEVSFCLKNF